MIEEWKWIKEFEGEYMVSNFGRLKSFRKNPKGHIMSEINAKGDYLSVILTGNGKKRNARIHVLVAETFIHQIPVGFQIHHIDGNKQNNRVDNLRILTSRDHAVITRIDNPDLMNGMINYNKYERPRKIQQVTFDNHVIAEYVNAKYASDITGICQRNILQVANKTEYRPGLIRSQAGGYIWRYSDESEVV